MRKISFLILTLFGLSACEPKAVYKTLESPQELALKDLGKTYETASQITDFNKFGFRLIHHIIKKDTVNPLISPYSINKLLLMTFAGAAGETEKAMAAFLNWENSTGFHKSADLIDKTLQGQLKDRYNIAVANKIFIGKDISIYDAFQNNLKTFYQTEIEALNFSNKERATSKINTWAAAKTDSLVKNICSPNDFNADTKLALINAVVFQGGWKHIFDKNQTYRKIFHGVVSEKETDYMFRYWQKFDPNDDKYTEDKYFSESEKKYAPFLYNENDYVRVMEFPYADGEASMYVFLPQLREKTADNSNPQNYYKWDEIEPHFQYDSIIRLIDNVDSIHGKMFVSLPKFKSTYRFDVKDKLIEMGLSIPFSGNADFSRISPVPLMINKITHQAAIEVDEYGTTAAAATLEFIATKSMQFDVINFKANIPFFYLIRDKKTGLILFLGKYTQVTDK